MRRSHVDVVIDAGVDDVWQTLSDWPRQTEWMFATTIESSGQPNKAARREGVGDAFSAVTGIGPLSVTDAMVVTKWDPPRRVDVSHVGKVIRGSGVFEVFALPGGRSRVSWTEYTEVPLGLLGLAVWPVVQAGFEWGARRSLVSLRRIIEGAHTFTG